MLELINTHQHEIAAIYLLGIVASLFIRFFIITVCIFILNNTRLKELKNLSNRAAKDTLKHSYFSLLWPLEIVKYIVNNARHFLKK